MALKSLTQQPKITPKSTTYNFFKIFSLVQIFHFLNQIYN